MRPIITLALSAVLAIALASCNNQSSLERQYVVWSDIDTDIQQIVMDEVDARIKINQADWACAIVLNERGKGIAGYEVYDSTTTHYHLTDKQAIGTLFMPFSLLMASATSFVDSSFAVPVQNKGWCPWGNREIVDSHPRDTILRVRDVIATSSYQGAGRALVGIFPEEKPQYTCLVMFGNPKGVYSAGVDCGGTVRRIAERIMTK